MGGGGEGGEIQVCGVWRVWQPPATVAGEMTRDALGETGAPVRAARKRRPGMAGRTPPLDWATCTGEHGGRPDRLITQECTGGQGDAIGRCLTYPKPPWIWAGSPEGRERSGRVEPLSVRPARVIRVSSRCCEPVRIRSVLVGESWCSTRVPIGHSPTRREDGGQRQRSAGSRPAAPPT